MAQHDDQKKEQAPPKEVKNIFMEEETAPELELTVPSANMMQTNDDVLHEDIKDDNIKMQT